MNFGELKTATYDWLQARPGNSVWLPSEIERYINDGQFEYGRQISKNYEGFFSAAATISEVENQSEYDLPTDLFQLTGVWEAITLPDQQRIPIRQINSSQDNRFSEFYSSSYRRAFFTRGQKKLVLNVASSVNLADSIAIEYIYRPTKMIDDDDEPWQSVAGPGGTGKDNLEEFHNMLWMHAAVFALAKEGRPDEAVFLRQELAVRKVELLDHLDDISSVEPRYVNYDDEDIGDTW